MAQARKKSSGGGGKKRGGRGPLLLVLGVAIGVGGVYLWQLISKRIETRSGIATLFTTSKTAERPGEPAKIETAKREPTKGHKPRYEFYTLLQNETVLPEREPPREKTVAKVAKPEEGVSYILQVGSYGNFEDADQLKAKLALSGLIAHIQKVDIDGKTFHRVRVGPYEKVEQLDAAADQLKQLGIRALRVKVKKGAG
jgi:cell division protein FtsN